MTGVMTDLAPVEARLWAILASYRDRLVPGSVYGVSTVTRPGAKAHAYFAGVSVAVDEPVFADLETLVARWFEAYIAAGQGRTVGE